MITKRGKLLNQESLCYNIWKRNRGCQGCSPGVAVRENREMIKLEYLDKKVYLIESCPIRGDGDVLSLEMIWVVTG